MAVHSSYLNEAFVPKKFRSLVTLTIRTLRKKTKEFDAIAFRGFSGSLMGPIVALALDKKMIIVRKEPSHAGLTKVEGADCEKFLIIDDFIGSGVTIKTIIQEIEKSKIKGTPVAVYLWKTTSTRDEYEGLPIWK